MGTLSKSQFKFKKHELAGAESAEDDQDFLRECFIDTGDISPLNDIAHPACIVVGRTGVGKTALLLTLRHEMENVAWIEPDELALQYISNSSMIRWLNNEGVDLDIFYRLLWKHILATEILKLKYKLCTEGDQRTFIQRLSDRFFGDKKKKEALDYLLEWGEKFWENTECRVHEVTETLEAGVRAKLGASYATLSSELSGGKKATTEEKMEIVHRAQEVVNQVQVQKLSRVVDILAEDFVDDGQARFYIVIDRLDEKWVHDSIRYRLIRALIETVREFRKIRTVKIVMAIRKDLLGMVFKETRNVGFQEEKYEALMLNLNWGKSDLIRVVDKRINKLISRQYTKGDVGWQDIFPPQIDRVPTDEYLVNRTLYRPRDIIQFVNCCIKLAVDQNEIKAVTVRDAESEYSRLRYRSLGDEWVAVYPDLLDALAFLKSRPNVIDTSKIENNEVDEFALNLATSKTSGAPGPFQSRALRLIDKNITHDEFKQYLIHVFYTVGAIGVRVKNGGVNWSFLNGNFIREAEILGNERIEICPMLYRVLGTRLAEV